MQRDEKLIKEILIMIRDSDKAEETWLDMVIKGYDLKSISYHVKLLYEMGLIEAIDLSSNAGQNWKPKRLTSAGHDYLNELCKPLSRKIAEHCLDVSGKILWIFVGGLIGAFTAILANSLFNDCN